ncbi:MAG: hypothetical protein ABF968_14555 [Acetobacter sp.]|uniref:Lectin-like protein BA14k n=2 Tax=Acetobacteraceae TaxID=433 RepID=A0AB33I801_ACEAC|nr:hypothetical protein [Acetobacter aceti]TCS34821.1 hypothetical protein EDC15_10229 [Acetobacter aceti NBRC 14818]BCK74601.1 hypothetical protein EMQ_0207 [Acetobacter aceti NBRC 14818]GAN58200.1 hypothetical protein Abac_035_007 [Acetobacter aceti NBRC 14818]GBO79880.1 hypothetical protein AA0242T_0582 [Acetobacter aceti NRIC 0242]
MAHLSSRNRFQAVHVGLMATALVFSSFGLSGCANHPDATSAAHSGRIPPQTFPPGTVTETPPPEGQVLVNDPSAPVNTPLCGTSAREANAMGQAIYPQPLTNGGACTQNACFDPATQTYIASDNSRRVCR